MIDSRRIRLVACDVDGTLVVNGRVVTPELREVFAELRRRGVETTLCTGRLPHWSEPVADELGLSGHLVCTEGGHVFDRASRARLFYAALPAAAVEQVVAVSRAVDGLLLTALGDDLIWAEVEEAARRTHWWGKRWQQVDDIRRATEPVVVVVSGPHATLCEVCPVLRERLRGDGAVVHDVEDEGAFARLKVTARLADKAFGAESLVRHLGGDSSQILAFGDYLNDLGVMCRAGASICPRDAHPAVCAVATRRSAWTAAEGFVLRELQAVFGLD